VCEETGDWPLDIDDLLRFSFQVAHGLDFLAAKNVSDLTSKKHLNEHTSRKHYREHLQQQLLCFCHASSQNIQAKNYLCSIEYDA